MLRLIKSPINICGLEVRCVCMQNAPTGGLLTEATVTPFTSSSKTSRSPSSVTYVDSMMVPVFTKMALSYFKCKRLTACVMP